MRETLDQGLPLLGLRLDEATRDKLCAFGAELVPGGFIQLQAQQGQALVQGFSHLIHPR